MFVYKATIQSGPLLEVKFYKSIRQRGKRNVARSINRSLTPDKMQKANKIRAEQNIRRLILCNFSEGDRWVRFSAPYVKFTEKEFEVRAVLPQRTFLEKVFLLHEEFAKPKENIRTERMSRHLYDIGQIMDTPIAEEALQDKALYQSVIDHRRTFIGLRGFDYDTLQPATLRIVPPENIVEEWKKDYEVMQGTMIYGDSLPFSQLIDKIRKLNERINGMG